MESNALLEEVGRQSNGTESQQVFRLFVSFTAAPLEITFVLLTNKEVRNWNGMNWGDSAVGSFSILTLFGGKFFRL